MIKESYYYYYYYYYYFIDTVCIICGAGSMKRSARPSVCLTDRHEPVGLLPSARRYRSTTAGAVQQAPALSSKCGQCHVDSRRSCFVNQRRLLATFYRPLGRNFRTNEPRECRDDSLRLSLGKFGTSRL